MYGRVNVCTCQTVQYIPRNMHTVFALLCFVVVIHWLIFPYPSGLLHWHCGNLTIASVPAKQPWWIWINTSCEFIMNDCITTTKQSTTNRVHISRYILYLSYCNGITSFSFFQGWTVKAIVVFLNSSGHHSPMDIAVHGLRKRRISIIQNFGNDRRRLPHERLRW